MAHFGAPVLLLVLLLWILLFPIGQLEDANARLLLAGLTPSKVCYVLADTGQRCFRAYLGCGMARFGLSVLLLVLVAIPQCPT